MKNHLHKMNRGIIALFIVTSMFYSCSEDDDVQNLEPEYSVKLKFENYDDYFEELHKVSNMGVEERIAYEKANGYRSKRSIQEEFYYSIDFEKFKSQDEIIQFVNNSEHLKIVYDENREMHIEIEDDYTLKSYLTDEIGMYQIDETFFQNRWQYGLFYK